MKVVYVSGKYRAKSKTGIERNIQAAREVAEHLWKQGYAVICPHLNTAHMDGIVSNEQFIMGDLEIVKRCDMIVMLPGWEDSPGANAEHDYAVEHGLEIVYPPPAEVISLEKKRLEYGKQGNIDWKSR